MSRVIRTSYHTNNQVKTNYHTSNLVKTSYPTNNLVKTSYHTNNLVKTSYHTNNQVSLILTQEAYLKDPQCYHITVYPHLHHPKMFPNLLRQVLVSLKFFRHFQNLLPSLSPLLPLQQVNQQ